MSRRIEAEHLHSEPAPPPARLRSVLVPLDLTPVSDRILRRVARLPLADDARVTLLHVASDDHAHPYRGDAERHARQALAEEARHLRTFLPRTVRVEWLVKTGAVLHEVTTLARAVSAELIAMGRGGGRAARDLFLGSTAERVIRQSKLPVLVIRLPARTAYNRPALALDLARPAHEIVGLTLRVLPRGRPRIPVIHAFTPPYEHMSYPSVDESVLDDQRAAHRRRASEELAQLLAGALNDAAVSPDAAPAWELVVRYGAPRMVVLQAVNQRQTDLLVLGTRAYGGLAHMVLGTVAGDLLREAACDVLIVPSAAQH